MIKIFLVFFISIIFALAITPVVRWAGIRLGAVDFPNQRKVHKEPVPRIGGIAILFSIFLSVVISKLLFTETLSALSWTTQRLFYVAGALFIFAVGLFDDFRKLSAFIKFLAQIMVASLAFYGGIRIEVIFGIKIGGIYFGLISWAITVFWFLLFINAINLIDGLDGLAAGVTFFAFLVMAVIAATKGDYLMVMKFAVLCGVLLGFLYYNFNPASIFLGDSGSYLIGYTVAALSIMGSVKSTAGTAFLIPLVALGVPVFDTILAPVRRFISGKNIFHADGEHIHHKLLQKGIESRNVVLILYGVTCVLCVLAIILMHLHDKMLALFFALLTVFTFFAVRKLGYFEYFFFDRIYGWLRDLTEKSRHTLHEFSFLDLKEKIKKSDSLADLWSTLCQVFEFMQFDAAELHVTNENNSPKTNPAMPLTWFGGKIEKSGMMRIEISAIKDNPVFFRLVLMKNIAAENISPLTLHRLQILRQSIEEAMKKIHD